MTEDLKALLQRIYTARRLAMREKPTSQHPRWVIVHPVWHADMVLESTNLQSSIRCDTDGKIHLFGMEVMFMNSSEPLRFALQKADRPAGNREEARPATYWGVV